MTLEINTTDIEISEIDLENKRKYQQIQYLKNKEKKKLNYEKNREKILERVKKYRETNIEKIRLREKRYCEKNKEKINERSKKYREKNIEKVRLREKRYREKNREKISLRKKLYREKNREKFRLKAKLYRERNREKINLRKKLYREKNREKFRLKAKLYYEKNREKVISRGKLYKERNRELIRKRNRIRDRERMKNPFHRINRTMSREISEDLSGKKNTGQWRKWVPYTFQDLKNHLEKRMVKGMSFKNYGKWHIDHIIPKSWFNFQDQFDEQFKLAWCLNNLQPLWAKINEIKKDNYVYNDQLINRKEFIDLYKELIDENLSKTDDELFLKIVKRKITDCRSIN